MVIFAVECATHRFVTSLYESQIVIKNFAHDLKFNLMFIAKYDKWE